MKGSVRTSKLSGDLEELFLSPSQLEAVEGILPNKLGVKIFHASLCVLVQ